MSEDVRHTGAIGIDPPLEWDEIRDSDFRPTLLSDKDVELDVREEPIPGGFTRRAHAVRPLSLGTYSGYRVVEHVQELVDTYGAGHTFTGAIECVHPEWGQWRVEVRDGQAVGVEPRVIWPGDDATADEVANLRSSIREALDEIEADKYGDAEAVLRRALGIES